MDAGSNLFMNLDKTDLEKYIKQIKSYESQVKELETTAQNEDTLKEKHPDRTLVLLSGVAGMHYHVTKETDEGMKLLESLVPGTELKLVREPENKHDRWAIAIFTNEGMQLGYVTRHKNEAIARLMDSGYVFSAYVEDINDEQTQKQFKDRAVTENYCLPYSIWMNRGERYDGLK